MFLLYNIWTTVAVRFSETSILDKYNIIQDNIFRKILNIWLHLKFAEKGFKILNSGFVLPIILSVPI